MIKIQNLSDLPSYFPSLPTEAVNFLKNADENTPCGRYKFDDTCYINVMTVETSPAPGLAEAHEIYTDIQVLLAGEETILYGDRTNLTPAVPYDASIEAAFYPSDGFAPVSYRTGEAIVLFPADAHLPGRAVNAPMTIKKAIVKLRYP